MELEYSQPQPPRQSHTWTRDADLPPNLARVCPPREGWRLPTTQEILTAPAGPGGSSGCILSRGSGLLESWAASSLWSIRLFLHLRKELTETEVTWRVSYSATQHSQRLDFAWEKELPRGWMVRGKGEGSQRETVAAGLPTGLVTKEGSYFSAPPPPQRCEPRLHQLSLLGGFEEW